MSWLVRCYLNYETIANLRIKDCYDWHQRVWEMFPNRPKRYPRPFLYRMIEKNNGCELWIMCREEPTMPKWATNESWKVSAVGDGFPFHHRYHFDLLANPTKRDGDRDSWQGRERIRTKHRRFNLTTRNEQCDWFFSKAEQHGFRLLGDLENNTSLDIEPRRDFRFNRKGMKEGLHVGVRYQGNLEVVDSKKFAQAFREGIGSAKSFGFGLLLLVPLI